MSTYDICTPAVPCHYDSARKYKLFLQSNYLDDLIARFCNNLKAEIVIFSFINKLIDQNHLRQKRAIYHKTTTFYDVLIPFKGSTTYVAGS